MLKLLQIWSISFAFHKSLLDLLLFWYILSVFLINHFLNSDGLGLWNQVFWIDHHKLNKDYLAKMKKNFVQFEFNLLPIQKYNNPNFWKPCPSLNFLNFRASQLSPLLNIDSVYCEKNETHIIRQGGSPNIKKTFKKILLHCLNLAFGPMMWINSIIFLHQTYTLCM